MSNKIVNGQVTNKRTAKTTHGSLAMIKYLNTYYVTIDAREFVVPAEIYNSLSVGDYISASYKRNWMLDKDVLVKLL